MKKIIYYATGNRGKFEVVNRFISENEPSIELKQFDKELEEVQTLDQKAIALSKAKQAWNLLHKPVLVDDSGIYFEHYNNFPGTLSKFVYHGIGYEGILKLTQDDNRATFRLYMIYKDSDKSHEIFEGICKGFIVKPETFEAHPQLPYDSVFKPEGSEVTYAQLRGTDQEHKFAYRLRALKIFLNWYKKR